MWNRKKSQKITHGLPCCDMSARACKWCARTSTLLVFLPLCMLEREVCKANVSDRSMPWAVRLVDDNLKVSVDACTVAELTAIDAPATAALAAAAVEVVVAAPVFVAGAMNNDIHVKKQRKHTNRASL